MIVKCIKIVESTEKIKNKTKKHCRLFLYLIIVKKTVELTSEYQLFSFKFYKHTFNYSEFNNIHAQPAAHLTPILMLKLYKVFEHFVNKK